MARSAALYRMVMPKHLCPYGRKSKWLLEHNGYQVEDHPLRTREETDDFMRKHEVETTPQAWIDGKRIGGYDDLRAFFGKPLPDAETTSYTPVIAIFAVSALIALAIFAFTMIGAGVGAAGTSMLALLASGVVPERRAAAAAVTWTMMIAGIVVAAGVAGALLDPFSEARLIGVAAGVALAAFALACAAIWRLEPRAMQDFSDRPRGEVPGFAEALREIMQETAARRFTVLIFVSMLAYSMQDLILEPFAGLVFGMSPGESTSLSGTQHSGVLLGMIIAGVGGSAFAGRLPVDLRAWIVAGCAGSGLALAALAMAALAGPGWPLAANVFVLGLCNGVFAVSAIGAMMGLAGAGENTREGVRMGVWGAAQAIAFGLGGLTGALGVDAARHLIGRDGAAFQLIFAIEACLFILAAVLAVQATRRAPMADKGVATA